MDFRVGMGYDSHRLTPNDDVNQSAFLLAGIPIPFNKHCIAHLSGQCNVC